MSLEIHFKASELNWQICPNRSGDRYINLLPPLPPVPPLPLPPLRLSPQKKGGTRQSPRRDGTEIEN
ncbi:MAG: hypothetical protein ACP5D7_22790 [Limnospira sp.]